MSENAAITIKPLDDANMARWDAFVDICPQATFFHKAGWKTVVERAFGHDTHFLYAESDGDILAVVPLVHINSRLFGNALTSGAFGVYGGVAAVDEAAADALEKAACDLADKLGVNHLEMRYIQQRHADWPTKDLYVTYRKEIDPDPEVNLKAIPRKQRAMVRKGIKAGLQGVEDTNVDRFFDMYSESVRNLGTPVYPKNFFEIIRDVFGDDCGILTIESEGCPVASVMSYYFRDQVLPFYGGGTAEARKLKANDFMYWDLMRRSAESGIRIFDYGRSKVGSGSGSFKKNWGFEAEPLHYEFYLVKADSLPDINPMNPKYRMFIQAWQRMPLFLSRRLGPFLARSLG